MTPETPAPIYLADYTPPAWLVDTIDLHFDLEPGRTVVRSRLALRRNPTGPGGAVVLDGQGLELLSLALDGRPLAAGEYRLEPERLVIPVAADGCVVESEVAIDPAANTALEGLYVSSGNFCTQCEAEGFRRITWFPDRPDVMARFTATLSADRGRYPVLLANGNPVASGEHPGGRHWVRWEDPFPKPCYLFALVAGDLACVEGRFLTMSGREVALRIYVEHHNVDKCDHAIASLQRAMKWDEERFGREYDLDIYMIVAVSDFNMGAMENKGLNIFNAKYVLARPDTATDMDYQWIEGVIGHEYFHNWTGNRITCRDWFQLSLKEGLTVFRDREFSADMGSRAVKRIQEVRELRARQFAEDAGPMAHPVRPDSYIEINNFYTATVYEKGAEVVGMIHTLLGAEGFRRGMDCYFERHDGQAVTVDDFVAAMEAGGGRDLGRFRRWYSQAGTPRLAVERHYDPATRRYTLTLRQSTPPTPGQPDKAPLHIPVAMGLLGRNGVPLPLRLAGEAQPAGDHRVLELREAEERFVFEGMVEEPLPSLLRGFSAPVQLELDYRDEELAFLLAHDPDPFNRWEAGQRLATKVLLGAVAELRAGRPVPFSATLAEAFRRLLRDPELDPALAAEALALPGEGYLAELVEEVEPQAIHEARLALRLELAAALHGELETLYRRLAAELRADGGHDGPAIGRRALKNACLGYLAELAEGAELAAEQFRAAAEMTDSQAALAALAQLDAPQREEALAAFHERWRDDTLVLDKWFSLQATARLPGTLAEVERLMGHPAFSMKNPNKVRALIGSFAHNNPVRFHAADGSGYRFLTARVLELNALNPQVAARMVGPLTRWRRYEPGRRALMRAELERIAATAGLCRDLYEVVAKGLAE